MIKSDKRQTIDRKGIKKERNMLLDTHNRLHAGAIGLFDDGDEVEVRHTRTRKGKSRDVCEVGRDVRARDADEEEDGKNGKGRNLRDRIKRKISTSSGSLRNFLTRCRCRGAGAAAGGTSSSSPTSSESESESESLPLASASKLIREGDEDRCNYDGVWRGGG